MKSLNSSREEPMAIRKVLVTASTFPRWNGDTEPGFVYELSLRLSKRFQVTVLAPHHPGAKRFEIVDGMRVHRFRYFFPSSLERLCYGGGILPNMKKSFLARLQLPFLVAAELFSLWMVAKKERPDIIHAHWILPQGFTAAIVSKLLGIPFVVTAHAGDVFPLNKPLFRLLSRFSVSSAAAVTVNSRFTKAAVEKIAVSKAVQVIPMGVDLKLFSSPSAAAVVRKKYSVKGKMLLFVGRLAEKKGVTYLITAMKSILQDFPGCKLIIVGDGPEKAALMQQSQQLGLSGSIIFTGSVPNSSLPSFYKAADVFILPSIVDSKGDTEGLGVVLLEAMAAGVPVVASNVGGIPDILIRNRTGLLVEQKDPDALAAAVIRLVENRFLAVKLAVAAKEHVRKNYSWELVSGRFAGLLKGILAPDGPDQMKGHQRF